ncbi:MAG: Hsp33 family molecular chaperone HslO [Thermaerobacter sp.]|nr:Hsp33 family molecular chaperone HslO [Thermaerobacter sp.]
MGNKIGEVIITDYRIRATAAGGLLRAVAVQTTEAARTAQEVHRAWPVAAAALGRLVSTAAILGADFKQDQARITVEVSGDGPLGRIVAETRPDGSLRARIEHSDVDLPLNQVGKLAVGQAVGRQGFFRVLRQDHAGEWYQSQVELQTGEIGDDFLHYLAQSEQIPSAVSVGVLVDEKGLIIGCGGVMAQALPGCPTDIVDQVAGQFDHLAHISRRLADGETLEALIGKLLPEPIRWYEKEPLQWQCWCGRCNIQATLGTLPESDIDDLIGDGGAEVTCHFCRQAYHFSVDDLKTLADLKSH